MFMAGGSGGNAGLHNSLSDCFQAGTPFLLPSLQLHLRFPFLREHLTLKLIYRIATYSKNIESYFVSIRVF